MQHGLEERALELKCKVLDSSCLNSLQTAKPWRSPLTTWNLSFPAKSYVWTLPFVCKQNQNENIYIYVLISEWFTNFKNK